MLVKISTSLEYPMTLNKEHTIHNKKLHILLLYFIFQCSLFWSSRETLMTLTTMLVFMIPCHWLTDSLRQLTDACDQGRKVETCCAKENKILRKRVFCLSKKRSGKRKIERWCLLIFDIRTILETFDQSDEEIWPEQHFDKFDNFWQI